VSGSPALHFDVVAGEETARPARRFRQTGLDPVRRRIAEQPLRLGDIGLRMADIARPEFGMDRSRS
jgi:hypothetical protein